MVQLGGIDTESIVSQLMAIEERPLNALEVRRTAAQEAADAIGRLRTSVEAFRVSAERLQFSSNFSRFASTVSNPDVIAATISGTAVPASLTFTVNQLATTHGLRSVGTTTSTAAPITDDAVIAVASGMRQIGIRTVAAGAGLGEGDVAVRVSQASAAARSTGTTPLAASTTINGLNNNLDVNVNGTSYVLTIADGTYDQAGLVDAVNTALTNAGAAATASLDNTGALVLETTREGSAASIQVIGGTARATLGMGLDLTANTGVNGVFDIDGTTTTVTNVEAGAAVAIATGAGTLDVELAGGMRVGERTVSVVSTGDRGLEDVVAAINGANRGVSAAAVKVNDTDYRLQLNATGTGIDQQINIDSDVFNGLGGMVESSAAQNAQITVGNGAGAYQIEASGNTFVDVMPGVSLTAKQVSTGPVTVSVNRNDAAIASDIDSMVSSLNALLAEISVQTRADPETGTQGALAGNSTIRRMADTLRSALADQVTGLATSLPSSVGIERGRDGSFSFDRAAFLEAIENDPQGVARLFTQGGTDTGDATFLSATRDTVSGTYAVDVTTAATRATSARLFDGGALLDSQLGIRVGDTTVTVDIQTGASAAQIISNINAALGEAGLDIVAEADATGVIIRADDWGAQGDFELNTDVGGIGTWNAVTGTDVAGTINGQAATGNGRVLTLSSSADDPAAGLSVEVAGGVTGAIGDVEYNPGIAARISQVTNLLTRADIGTLTTSKEAADARVEGFTDQIERLEDRLITKELNLRRQWASFQSVLSQLQAQGSWLSSQLGTLG